jgi:hypothetical protein
MVVRPFSQLSDLVHKGQRPHEPVTGHNLDQPPSDQLPLGSVRRRQGFLHLGIAQHRLLHPITPTAQAEAPTGSVGVNTTGIVS